MQTIILSTKNVVSGTNNTQYKYRFPNSTTFDKNTTIALLSVNMYYSWFNIDGGLYNNNTLSYKWFDSSGSLSTTFSVVFPDGYYDISYINKYMQSVMFTNGHWLRDGNGAYIYYLTWDINVSKYGVQLYADPLPSALPTGYTMGTNASFPWILPTSTTSKCPQMIILSTNKFCDLIGFNSGNYPSTAKNSKYSITSQYTPTLNPASSLLMTCSLCNQPLSVPNNVLYSFNVGNASFGDQFTVQPPALAFVPISQGNFSEFYIEFKDQDYRSVKIQDPQLVIMLAISTMTTEPNKK